MPMRWTPDNDRILLLKLIETHGISVDSDKIRAAWPTDSGDQPTARAITERFHKLRKLAGVKASRTPGGGSGKARASTAKFTTPRKRKNKAASDDSSDADDHMTEEESPTKKQFTSRGSARGRGRGRGGRVPGSSARVKSEDATDTFDRDAAEAAALTQTSQQNPFAAAGYTLAMGNVNDGMNGAMHGGMNGDMNGGMNGDMNGGMNGGMNNGMNGGMMNSGMNANLFHGFDIPGVPIDDPFIALPDNFNNNMQAFPTNMQAFSTDMQAFPTNMQDSLAPTAVPRGRSIRRASAQASEGMAATLRRQKSADRADGEKSSGEDSQASEFVDFDTEFV